MYVANPIFMWEPMLVIIVFTLCNFNFSVVYYIYSLYNDLHKPHSWSRKELLLIRFEGFKGPSDQASHSSSNSESSCETSHQFDQICWLLGAGVGSYISWQNLLSKVAAFSFHQRKPMHCSVHHQESVHLQHWLNPSKLKNVIYMKCNRLDLRYMSPR